MIDFDEVIRWSDLGRPDKPIELDIVYLGGYVHVEQQHIDKAAEIGGNPDVLLREDSDPDLAPGRDWEIVRIAPEGRYLK